MKRVVIIEDQTAIRDMISEVLKSFGEYDIVGTAGEGQKGVEITLREKPDLVILDVMLPGLNGTEVLRRFSRQLRDTRVLIFSGHQSPSLVKDLIQDGAHGFIEKSSPLSELKKGIEIIISGGSYFGPEVAQLLREAFISPSSDSARNGVNLLTAREREILQLIAESHSTKEIASKLSISVKTAENHRTNLMKKLNLHDVASLVRFSVKHGLIDPHRPA
jgi:DNA-binding NarL/FixJ family response regulator